MNVKQLQKAIEILKNPRTRDVISLAKDAPDNQVRAMKVGDDKYFWPAYDAEHETMMHRINAEDFGPQIDVARKAYEDAERLYNDRLLQLGGDPYAAEVDELANKYYRQLHAARDDFENLHAKTNSHSVSYSIDTPEILTYDKGKFHPEYNRSYIDEAAEMNGTSYEDERKDWMMRNFGLPSLAAFGIGSMEEQPQEFAAGGLVEAGYKGGMHGLTMAADEPVQSLIGAAYAKLLRPELFEDFTFDELVEINNLNQQAERAQLEEEHPYAYNAGMLASGLAPLGIAKTLGGQMGASALMNGLYGFNEGESPEEIAELAAMGAAFPAAFRHIKKLAIPTAGMALRRDAAAEDQYDLTSQYPYE